MERLLSAGANLCLTPSLPNRGRVNVVKGTKAIMLAAILTIVAIGQIVLSFLLYDKNGSPIVRNVGWVVLWISAIFGWLPIYTFRKWGGVTKGKSYVQTTVLVDRGIYAIVRHPQYLAGMMIGVALTLIAQHWLVGVLGAIAIVIYYVDTFEEEESAVVKFGESYTRYMESVPRVNFVVGIVRLLRHRRRR
jgi:protein-S-isoprenylcysteine O-methyltransferase Ste14